MGLLTTAALVLAALLATVVALVAIGLKVTPRPFAAYPQKTPALQWVALPEGLPAPVARFYQVVYGDQLPVITSAVITGRGSARVAGIRFPARMRFTHIAGQGYRHYIETTLFGYPVMKVNEWYLDGRSRLELPMGVVEDEPKVDAAANLGLWAESLALPSIFLTDSRIRWEPVDENHARLFVPLGDGEDQFLVRFDPETGLVRYMEAMRWKEAASEQKRLWRAEAVSWERIDGVLLPVRQAATWADEKDAWLVAVVEEVVYNVDVTSYIRARGE